MSITPSPAPGAPTVIIERRGPLAILWLNRPDALNAMTIEMMGEFNRAVSEVEADPAISAIAITGVGRGFCAGLDSGDLNKATATLDRRLDERGMDPEMPGQFIHLLKVGKPIIAAVNGPAAGLGFILAMICDLRFVSQDAFFTTAFSQRGLISEHGTSWLLPRIVGHSNALDLLWSPRKVGAEEAQRMGLANRVLPAGELLDAVAVYVSELAAKASPRSMAIMKSMVYRHLEQPLKSALVEADREATAGLEHPDVREGVQSFLERRPPQFAPWTGEGS